MAPAEEPGTDVFVADAGANADRADDEQDVRHSAVAAAASQARG